MSAQSDAIVAQLTQAVGDVAKILAAKILANLRRPPDQGGTPVDTGNARARWKAQAGAGGDIATYVLADGSILVSNDAPYIMRLNDGWSKQAPAGFIERAIAEAEAEVEAMIGRPIEIGTADTFGAQIAENIASAYGFAGVFGGD